MTVNEFKDTLSGGKYAWPGGYPLFFIMADNEPLSFEAAKENKREIIAAIKEGGWDKQWTPVAVEVNWEDENLYCAHTGERIESAYGED